MGLAEAFTKNWSNILTLGCIIVAAFIEAWQQATVDLPPASRLPRLEGVWHYAPLVLITAAGITWLAGRRSRKSQISVATAVPVSAQPTSSIVPGIPSISALHGKTPEITFDAQEMLKHAYYSPMTAEVENDIKTIAHKTYGSDPEAFYARFIGVGMVALLHNETWHVIFKSQLLMLQDMVRRNGWMPLADAKKFYDKAVADNPKMYTRYAFEPWLNYMKNQTLLIRHPTDMLEITERGKDFLRYLAHWGRNANEKVG